MRDAFTNTDINAYGNGYRDGISYANCDCDGYGNDSASYADGNGDSYRYGNCTSEPNSYSYGAADNTYTAATPDAAAAPIDHSDIWKINGNWRSDSPVPVFHKVPIGVETRCPQRVAKANAAHPPAIFCALGATIVFGEADPP